VNSLAPLLGGGKEGTAMAATLMEMEHGLDSGTLRKALAQQARKPRGGNSKAEHEEHKTEPQNQEAASNENREIPRPNQSKSG
jgi:hypothetical protein